MLLLDFRFRRRPPSSPHPTWLSSFCTSSFRHGLEAAITITTGKDGRESFLRLFSLSVFLNSLRPVRPRVQFIMGERQQIVFVPLSLTTPALSGIETSP